jgi:anti-sigma B factor antagonist
MAPDPEPLPLPVRHPPDGFVVSFCGFDRLDEYNSEAVGRFLDRLVAGRAGARLYLDLRGVRYATSAALGRLVGLHRRLRAAGGRLVLVAPEPAVAEALAVTRIDTVLEVRPAVPAPGATESLSP